MQDWIDKLIMGILTEISIVLRNIVLFWILICLVGAAIYCITRLISYAIYKSKLQVYFNLKTEEEQNVKEEQEERQKIIIQKQK